MRFFLNTGKHFNVLVMSYDRFEKFKKNYKKLVIKEQKKIKLYLYFKHYVLILE